MIISKVKAPPGGWWYQADGVSIKGMSFEDLVFHIKAHFTNNRKPLENPEQFLMDYFATKFPALQLQSTSVMQTGDVNNPFNKPKPAPVPVKPSALIIEGAPEFKPMLPQKEAAIEPVKPEVLLEIENRELKSRIAILEKQVEELKSHIAPKTDVPVMPKKRRTKAVAA